MTNPNIHRIETLDGMVGIDVELPADYPVAFEQSSPAEPWSQTVERHTALSRTILGRQVEGDWMENQVAMLRGEQ